MRRLLAPALAILGLAALLASAAHAVTGPRLLPMENDEAIHLLHAFQFTEALLHRSAGECFQLFWRFCLPWPPLYAGSLAAFCLLLNKSINTVLLAHFFYSLILLTGVWLIARKINGQKAAALAILLISAYPLTLTLYTWFIIEFSLMAMVTITIACLVYCDAFRNARWSYALGISFGLGVLTKWTFFFFTAVPCLAVALHSLRRPVHPLVRQNIRRCLLLFLLCGGVIYLAVTPECLRVASAPLVRTAAPIPLFSAQGLLFYGVCLVQAMSVVAGIIAVVAMAGLRPFASLLDRVLLLWVLSAYVILTLLPIKWGHYLAPALPALAIISACGIIRLLNSRWRPAVRALALPGIAGLALYTLLIEPFLFHTLAPVYAAKAASPGPGSPNQDERIDYFRHPQLPNRQYCRRENAAAQRLIRDIRRIAERNGTDLSVGVIDLAHPLSFWTLSYLGAINNFFHWDLCSLLYNSDRFFRNADNFDVLVVQVDNRTIPDESAIARLFHLDGQDRIRKESTAYYRELTRRTLSLLTEFQVAHSYLLYTNRVYVLEKKPSAPPTSAPLPPEPSAWEPAGITGTHAGLTFPAGDKTITLKLRGSTVDLYWNTQKITAGIGCYTSLRSDGIWYDSTSWNWEITGQSDTILTIRGESRILPLAQTWTFQVLGDRLRWDIWMSVYERMHVSAMQTNIMLDPVYTEWATAHEHGTFPAVFKRLDYDQPWPTIASFSADRNESAAAATAPDTGMPRVDFSCLLDDRSLQGAIVHSDSCCRGRVLQYRRRRRWLTVIPAGSYHYFQGQIGYRPTTASQSSDPGRL